MANQKVAEITLLLVWLMLLLVHMIQIIVRKNKTSIINRCPIYSWELKVVPWGVRDPCIKPAADWQPKIRKIKMVHVVVPYMHVSIAGCHLHLVSSAVFSVRWGGGGALLLSSSMDIAYQIGAR